MTATHQCPYCCAPCDCPDAYVNGDVVGCTHDCRAPHAAHVIPLGARVTVRVPDAPAKIGSLWVPDTAKESYTICQAEVVARGKDVRDQRLQPGALVITKRFGGVPHDTDRSLWTVWEEQILAIVAV